MTSYTPAQSKGITKLKKLKTKISLAGDAGLKYRIDFVITAYTHGLKEDLVNYKLYDIHHIGERDFDTCFEMYDGDLVVHGIIKATEHNPTLKLKLKTSFDPQCYKEWLLVSERVEKSHKEKQTEQNNPDQFKFAI
jgi:hypothetical protein